MSKSRSRDFLKRCAEADEFNIATANSLRKHKRMSDREAALRFCAFWLGDVDSYQASRGSMDVFLEAATRRLDDPADVSDRRLEELYQAFVAAMRNSHEVFGGHAFRKWPHGATDRNPINKPLFETWSYALSQYDQEDVRRRKEAIVREARDLMTNDRAYIDAITTSTGDPGKVALRFERATQAATARL